jgi:hypothetical protein
MAGSRNVALQFSRPKMGGVGLGICTCRSAKPRALFERSPLSRGRAEPGPHFQRRNPRFSASTTRLLVRDGRPFLSAGLRPDCGHYWKKLCICAARFPIASTGGKAILWAFLRAGRRLHSTWVDVFCFCRQILQNETQFPWFTSINEGTGLDKYQFLQRSLSNFPIWPVFQPA